jgi:hypothetical protein
MSATSRHILTAKPILTVDIVNFSIRGVEEQAEAVQALISILDKAIPQAYNHPSARIWSPAGDGGAITFWDTDIRTALDTAISVGKFVREYNEGVFFDDKSKDVLQKPNQELQVRMGIHFGTVSKETDFDARENVWGNGMNISARLISLARPGQILISKEFYDAADLRGGWKGIEITRIGKWWAKHNQSIILYNVNTSQAGIRYSEVDEWFGPLHYPLEQAIRIYEGMLQEEFGLKEHPFRVAIIAKRILDLEPQHEQAQTILESISSKRHNLFAGQRELSDPFFSPLSPETILHFFRNAQFRVFERGESIVEEGAKAESMMMIVSGEVNLYRDGKIVTIYDKQKKAEVNYVFREGQIIGEMGLFNIEERRNATLKAGKRSMTLRIDYGFIKPIAGTINSRDNIVRTEIQRQIWRYYCNRTVENKLIYHDLFQKIPEVNRVRILDTAEFSPVDYQERPEVTIEDIWDNWILVVAGNLTVYSKYNDEKIEYVQNEIIGPIRLFEKQAPYSRVESSPDTQFIRFPYSVVYDILNRFHEFEVDCLVLGAAARKKLSPADAITG